MSGIPQAIDTGCLCQEYAGCMSQFRSNGRTNFSFWLSKSKCSFVGADKPADKNPPKKLRKTGSQFSRNANRCPAFLQQERAQNSASFCLRAHPLKVKNEFRRSKIRSRKPADQTVPTNFGADPKQKIVPHSEMNSNCFPPTVPHERA